jgi:2',3'-cyclic-nucleotide 2'-phosphodiesterase (5'-nucleotidase family)
MRARPRQLFVILLSLALFACSGLRCSGEPPERAAEVKKPRPDLRLLLLTDPKGYLEPCGCQQRPLGGVDKLARVVGQLRAEGVPTLMLAAGDLFFGTEVRPEDESSFLAQANWGAETLLAAWGRLGLDAATPGKLDFNQKAETVDMLLAASKFPWLVDNLSGDRTAKIARGQVFNVAGRKIGVLGVLGPDPTLRLAPNQVLDSDLTKIARESIAVLRAQGATFVVALVSGDRRAAREVEAAHPDVVLMGGLDLELPLPPALHGKTVLMHAGRQGQRVVQLDLSLATGEPHDESTWTRREAQQGLRQQAAALREKIAAWEKAKAAEKDLATQRARLAEMDRTLAEKPSPNYTGRWFSAEVHELGPEIGGDPEIAQAMDRYDQKVNEHNRTSLADRLPPPAKEGSPHYVGSDTCKSCHEPAYTWWRNTKHGRAYETLEKVHKEFNLSCVACHVTGYNQPGGSTVTHVENLKDVGCENCHGAGSQHVQEPAHKGLVARDTNEATCTGCHTHEHSDRFVYEAFKTLLVAPGHGLPAAKAKEP